MPTTETPLQSIMRLVDRAGPDGITQAQLIDQSEHEQVTVEMAVSVLKRAGKIVEDGNGTITRHERNA